jgi:hypothetical protein
MIYLSTGPKDKNVQECDVNGSLIVAIELDTIKN